MGWSKPVARLSSTRALPKDEGWPPFLIVVDVGHSIELFADFTRSGRTYLPFSGAVKQIDKVSFTALPTCVLRASRSNMQQRVRTIHYV